MYVWSATSRREKKKPIQMGPKNGLDVMERRRSAYIFPHGKTVRDTCRMEYTHFSRNEPKRTTLHTHTNAWSQKKSNTHLHTHMDGFYMSPINGPKKDFGLVPTQTHPDGSFFRLTYLPCPRLPCHIIRLSTNRENDASHIYGRPIPVVIDLSTFSAGSLVVQTWNGHFGKKERDWLWPFFVFVSHSSVCVCGTGQYRERERPSQMGWNRPGNGETKREKKSER